MKNELFISQIFSNSNKALERKSVQELTPEKLNKEKKSKEISANFPEIHLKLYWIWVCPLEALVNCMKKLFFLPLNPSS